VAGELGADLPRLAALGTLGLVASGLGLRLRQRLIAARNRAPVRIEDLKPEIAETHLQDQL
jgi:hypothetical protein